MPPRSQRRNPSVASTKMTDRELSEPPTEMERLDSHEEEETGLSELEGNDRSTSDEEEPAEEDEQVVNPSKDIKGDLERALDGGEFSLKGSFYYSKSFSSAPNPRLKLNQVGVVGLPMSGDVAKRVISKCTQAPFGKGERTVVDKNVRDTWEMDTTRVIFENPAWKKWIERTIVPEVCESLGVNVTTTMPRAEFYKLLLYEKGSHFLSHQDTEKTPGMFATIIIILPSKFTGGSLRLSHAKNKALVDASTHSSFATHVTAWYTDVYHSVNKVQSGYRLALSYNLVHTSAPSLKPTLTYLSVEAQELRHILLSWKQKEYPDKLLYLLEHEYSEYNLQASSLKGEDAARVAYLRAVAEPLRFRLCLVTVELHESGQGDDDGGYNYCDPYAEASDEDSDEDSDSDSNLDKGKKHPTISLVEESEFTINDAFDLDGNDVELKKDLDLDDDDCIPYPLSTTEPDEEEYGGYTGNEGGTMELWYRRTALLIWPASRDSEIVLRDYAEYAKENLEGVTSQRPTRIEREVVTELLNWMKNNAYHKDMNEVVEVVTRAAVHWKDVDMWADALRAARLDRRLGPTLPAPSIAKDVGVLGFEKAEDFLTGFMSNCKSNADRTDLLSALEALTRRKNSKGIKEWISKHRKPAPRPQQYSKPSVRNVDVPKQDPISGWMESTRTHGGAYLQNTIIPHLKGNPSRTLLLDFAAVLHNSSDLATVPPGILNDSIKDILFVAISHFDPFPFIEPPLGSPDRKSRPDITRWFLILELARKTDYGQLIVFFSQSMQSFLKHSNNNQIQLVTKEFLPAAMNRWTPGLERMILPFYLGPLVLTLYWCNNSEDTMNSFKLRLGDYCESAITVLQGLAASAHMLLQRAVHNVEVASATVILDTICQTVAHRCRLNKDDLPIAVHTLFSYDICNSIQNLLDRLILHSSQSGALQELVQNRLIPFIVAVINSLKNLRRNWSSEPVLRSIAVLVMHALELVGPKPSSVIPLSNINLECDCTYCKDLAVFVFDGRTEMSITALISIRKHIEKQLNIKGDSWGFTATTIKGRSPHTLKITKAIQANPKEWQAKREVMFVMLNALGTLSVQKQVMADKWSEVCQSLGTDPSDADTNPDAFQKVALANLANITPLPDSNIITADAEFPQASALSQATPPILGQTSQSNPVVTSSSTTTSVSTSTSRTSKRSHGQAINQVTSTRTQGVKRSRLPNRPMEIIELSDSD